MDQFFTAIAKILNNNYEKPFASDFGLIEDDDIPF